MTDQQRRILTVLLVPVFMTLLAISSINVVLPALQSGIGATDSQLQWVLAGYTLAFGVVLVAAGRAGDVEGRGRLFIAGLVLFALGSLLSGVATTGSVLVVSRLITGLGSGLLNPQTIGFIQQYYDGQRRARAFASFGAVVGLSVAVGPLLAGAAVEAFGDQWGWRLTFLINVPIALGAIWLARRWLPSDAFTRSPGRADLDPVGMLLFGLATLTVMLPFLERGVGPILFVLVPVGLAMFAGWVVWERRYAARGRTPMVQLALFRTRSYRNGALLIALVFAGATSIFVIIALYLQQGQDATALQAALVGLPSAAATGVASTIAGRHVLRLGRPLVALGIATSLLSIVGCMAVIWAHDQFGLSPWWLTLTITFLGTGQGMTISPNQTLSLLEVPRHQSGAAGGVMQTGQRIGTSVGTALITATFFVLQPTAGWDTAALAALGIVGLLLTVALVVALMDIRGTRRA